MQKTSIVISVLSLLLSIGCVLFVLFCKPWNCETETAGTAVSQESTAASGSESSTQYVMYVGTNDKDTYSPKFTQEEARDIVDRVCLKYFGGYTLQDATGAWTDDSGNPTHEYTLVCYFDGVDKETVYKAADEVIKELNQNSVLIESTNLQIEYYSGK